MACAGGPTIKPNERTNGISFVPREAQSVWPNEVRPYRLTVRTSAFQADNRSSILRRATSQNCAIMFPRAVSSIGRASH